MNHSLLWDNHTNSEGNSRSFCSPSPGGLNNSEPKVHFLHVPAPSTASDAAIILDTFQVSGSRPLQILKSCSSCPGPAEDVESSRGEASSAHWTGRRQDAGLLRHGVLACRRHGFVIGRRRRGHVGEVLSLEAAVRHQNRSISRWQRVVDRRAILLTATGDG
jgi:hypothetical protein